MSATLSVKQIVESLNLTGNFLEASIFSQLIKSGHFLATAEWPYTQPTFQGTADIIALNHHAEWDSEPLVFFAIECKKVRSEQKVWVFDVSRTNRDLRYPMIKLNPEGKIVYESRAGYLMPDLGVSNMDNSPIYNKGFELRESDGSLNRNESEKIYLSLTQANKATVAVRTKNYKEIFRVPEHIFDDHPTAIIPVVITNAIIKTITYNPDAIDAKTGEIKHSDVAYEDKDWIIFDYALPDDLQLSGKYQGVDAQPIKRPTFIISASKAVEIMKLISAYLEY